MIDERQLTKVDCFIKTSIGNLAIKDPNLASSYFTRFGLVLGIFISKLDVFEKIINLKK